ncbi:PTS system trehalose-specific EIIBC component [Pallidibacillus thermolactis]|jgi:trehalose PTS system EIIBC or EIIBCA component|uniref:PTS system trehalose-specific EIIBC component n=1 Tax=Pallidibacillus thermolactis TaxID=251051 RepID=UPI0021D8C437|nr:PTS system trehalose-specific EIIBC component [Pallidibacillus thermolactis]MCU9600442.1 PTS system trehalose-specific EIIBC component [Pallidibacillus thermolactis subsp. kokeshiiformis]
MANQARNIALVAPLTGKVVAIENVPDQTFSEKMMGDGLAIEPTDGKVVAPVDGEVVVTFPTKHAVGLKTASGMELLIHVGLETVHMDGEGFDMHVKQGDKVKAGDLLLTFDLQLIKKKAASHITPVIITTGELVQSIRKTNDGTVIAGESTLLEITLKGQSEESSKEKVVTQSGMEYSEEAKQIVEAIGGIENINAATHCVTRLRFALDNEDIVDKDKLEKIDVVKGTFSANGQFQIVIGQGTVDKVYKALVHETGIKEATKEEVKAAGGQKLNPLQRGIKVLADIFIPILPAIVMAGLLLGLNNILVNPIFTDQPIIEMYPSWAGVADMINVIANTAFTFLPALIGWSAVKRFGGNPLLGIVLGLILVHPSLMPASDYAVAAAKGEAPTWNLFGFEVNMMGYQGQVLPVLVASWVLASIERWLRKRVIDSLQLLVVAPVALLVTGFLAFIVIGPVTFTIGNWITNGLIAIFEAVPLIGGLIYGLFYAPLVITGMHHTFLAVDLQLIGSTGSTFLWPIVALSNIAQGSAVFAMFLATKNEKLKGLAGTSGISAWLGVTEPAMFGVNLQYRYPFIAAIIGAAIAGALITVSNVQASSIGVGGIPGFLSISNSIGAFFIGMLIVIVVPFIITFIIAKRKQLEN